MTISGNRIGWSVVSVAHRWYPLLGEPSFQIMPDGLPTCGIFPLGFLENGSQALLDTWKQIQKQFPEDSNVYQQWHEFVQRPDVPKTDDVMEHMKAYGTQLYIPLAEEGLFRPTDSTWRSPENVPSLKVKERNSDKSHVFAECQPSVRYRGNKGIHDSITTRKMEDGSGLFKVAPPYKKHTIKELRNEIRRRNLADHDSKTSKGKEWYCKFLEADDLVRDNYMPYYNLPIEALHNLARQEELDLLVDKLQLAKSYAAHLRAKLEVVDKKHSCEPIADKITDENIGSDNNASVTQMNLISKPSIKKSKKLKTDPPESQKLKRSKKSQESI